MFQTKPSNITPQVSSHPSQSQTAQAHHAFLATRVDALHNSPPRGVGIRGKIPISKMTLSGKIAASLIIGLNDLNLAFHCWKSIQKHTRKYTYHPHNPQNFLTTHFPLPISQSSYLFNVLFRSVTSTLSLSIARLAATYEPAIFRQLEQWHR